MTTALDIGRVLNRYEVPEGLADGHALARRGDALTRGDVFRRVERRLPSLLAEAGLPPTALVALREVSVRMQLRDTSVHGEVLAEAWAHAVARGVSAQLARAHGGRLLTDDLVVFPDRTEAEELLLGRILGGADPEWWWDAVDDAPTLRRPVRWIGRWVMSDPGSASARLARLLRSTPCGTERLVTGPVGAALLSALATRRESRWKALAGESDASPAEVRLLDPDVVAGLTATDRHVLGQVRDVAARRLAAFVLAVDRRPALRVRGVAQLDALLAHLDASGPEAKPGAGLPRPEHLEARGALGDPLGDEPSTTDPSDVTASAPPTGAHTEPLGEDLATPREDPQIPGEERPCDVHHVQAGGLLFATLWCAREVLREHRVSIPSLPDRLLALGVAVLDRAFGTLPHATAEQAVAAESPVLAVFAGLDRALLDTDRLLAAREASRQSDARGLAARLAEELPDDMRPCAGPDPRALPDDPASRRLAALVLRAGELTVTSTHADLALPLSALDLPLRRDGWDLDPGWLPHLGRILRFHYVDP